MSEKLTLCLHQIIWNDGVNISIVHSGAEWMQDIAGHIGRITFIAYLRS